MFKVIDPFVLAYELEDNAGQKYKVESIRTDNVGNARVLLRNMNSGLLSSQILRTIPDWKVNPKIAEKATKISVKEHLDKCYQEIKQELLRKYRDEDITQLVNNEESAWGNLPPYFGRQALLELRKASNIKKPRLVLLAWLEEDKKLWDLKDSHPTEEDSDTETYDFVVPYSRKTNRFTQHCSAACRSARREVFISPDSDVSLVAYLIGAVEECCFLNLKEIIGVLTAKNRDFQAPSITCKVHIEQDDSNVNKKPKAQDNKIIIKYGTLGISITLPLSGQQTIRTVNIRLSFFPPNRSTVKSISRNNLFKENLGKIKNALEYSMESFAEMNISTLDSLKKWLDENIRLDSPNRSLSLWALSKHKEIFLRNLQDKRNAGEEMIKQHIASIIAEIPSNDQSATKQDIG